MLLFSVNTNAQSSNRFEGIWAGQGYQLNSNETWSIKLTIQEDAINIDYQSLGCQATLSKIKVEKRKLFLGEALTVKGTCVDDGKIELEWISKNEIRFKWFFSNGEIGSFATLIKL